MLAPVAGNTRKFVVCQIHRVAAGDRCGAKVAGQLSLHGGAAHVVNELRGGIDTLGLVRHNPIGITKNVAFLREGRAHGQAAR